MYYQAHELVISIIFFLNTPYSSKCKETYPSNLKQWINLKEI